MVNCRLDFIDFLEEKNLHVNSEAVSLIEDYLFWLAEKKGIEFPEGYFE